MKRNWQIAATAALALLLSGCEQVSWLQPMFTGQDIVQEPGLVGVWRHTEKETDTFTIRAEDDHYVLVVPEKDAPPTLFDAYAVRLGGELYLDAVTKGGPGIPEHLYCKVTLLDAGTLEFRILDGSRVLDLLKTSNLLPHKRVREGKSDTRFVITAEPWEVQDFLLRYGQNLWENAETYKRQ